MASTVLHKLGARSFSAQPIRTVVKKLNSRKAVFQVESGEPVYVKGGFTDQTLYRFSALLSVSAAGLGLANALGMIFGAKKGK